MGVPLDSLLFSGLHLVSLLSKYSNLPADNSHSAMWSPGCMVSPWHCHDSNGEPSSTFSPEWQGWVYDSTSHSHRNAGNFMTYNPKNEPDEIVQCLGQPGSHSSGAVGNTIYNSGKAAAFKSSSQWRVSSAAILMVDVLEMP